ncbi:MAG: phosphatase PAP2 family protein [Cardiobacteriaceae bacterium]|nr:phosphatase PAP2 family protein [Cardiobacteriaceae bacterium]
MNWKKNLIINSKIYANEYLWGVFLLISAIRLLFHCEYFYFALTVVFLFSLYFNILFYQKIAQKNNYAYIFRALYYLLLMNIFFLLLRDISALINEGKKDELLYNIDKFISKEYIGIYLENYSNKFITEVLAIAYLLFFPQLIFFCFATLRSRELTIKFYSGLFSLYAIGYIGYITIPAIGPYDFLANRFNNLLEGYKFYSILAKTYPMGTNFTDVFPSLHCAISAFNLFFAYKFMRKYFYFWLVPNIFLIISTVYLRYHYLIDCIAGIFLAIFCFYFIAEREKIYR